MEFIQVLLRMTLVLVLSNGSQQTNCPESKNPLHRIGNSRFYVFHDTHNRKNNQNWTDAKAMCESVPNFRLAEVRKLTTFHYLGRMLEAWVNTHMLQDTWYWVNAYFDSKTGVYKWGSTRGSNFPFSNFFYRQPRPLGVGSQIDYHNSYMINSTVDQCVTLALPLPGLATTKKQMKSGMIFGHSTSFDERPCESNQKRHTLCESTIPICDSKSDDPFYLSEDKDQYFETGNWIFGDRKYIVTWKQMTRDSSRAYCKKLGLQLFDPIANEKAIVPHLKLWSRNITLSQFWTDWRYEVVNDGGTFYNSVNQSKAHQKAFIKFKETESVEGRSKKTDLQFCVAAQITYEFKHQLPCPRGSEKACAWSFINYVPANCENPIGVICQHSDHHKRIITWQSEWITSPDKYLNDGMEATIEFGYEGNKNTRRSRYKQTFGSLTCPKSFRMIRDDNMKWYIKPNGTKILTYDYTDSYWVVDKAGFQKNSTSLCSLSVALAQGGRRVNKVNCAEWHFYICEKIDMRIKLPADKLPYDLPKSPGWNEKRHARTYPIV